MEQFSSRHFEEFSALIYDTTGIKYGPNKRVQLESKIKKLLLKNAMDSYDEYFKLVTSQNRDNGFQEFVNGVTTNTTEFFRESDHFDFIRKNISRILQNNPDIKKNNEIRVWCAASSTGQEPVTIAITLKEALEPKIKVKILATDISSKVLKKAVSGLYHADECSGLSNIMLKKYFVDQKDGTYKVKDELAQMIHYRQFNLMNEFTFKKQFDIIFCRNVMIYFPSDIQQMLINKLYDTLKGGGYFFTALTEAIRSKKHFYDVVGPSIYFKKSPLTRIRKGRD